MLELSLCVVRVHFSEAWTHSPVKLAMIVRGVHLMTEEYSKLMLANVRDHFTTSLLHTVRTSCQFPITIYLLSAR